MVFFVLSGKKQKYSKISKKFNFVNAQFTIHGNPNAHGVVKKQNCHMVETTMCFRWYTYFLSNVSNILSKNYIYLSAKDAFSKIKKSSLSFCRAIQTRLLVYRSEALKVSAAL